MSASVSEWLAAAGEALAEALGRKLSARPGSVFRTLGAATTQAIAGRLIAALTSDAPAKADEAGRAVVQELVGELAPRGLVFADLRLLTTALRTALLAAEVTPEGRARIEAWLFTIVTAAATQFLAHREATFHEQASRLEVRQLESQIGELKAAYEEKTRLLEQIRQASTPIAPIHDGILVVPVVGVLDGFRAEVLTDKLLNAVTSARAHVVLVDVSGVPVFDEDAAQHVLRAAQAVRLLGSRVVLVGLSPEMARTIVDLGLDLAGVRTLGSLQDGLTLALSLRKLRIAPIAERK